MNVIFSTVPIFLFLIIGYVLRALKKFPDEARRFLVKLLFNFALPASVFYSIVADCDVSKTFRPDMLGVNLLTSTVICVISFGLSYIMRDRSKRGSFIICSFRSNMGYMGFPLMELLFPGLMGAAGIINGFDSALVTVLSVIALEAFRESDGVERSPAKVILRKLLLILKNPLVIATALGLLFAGLGIRVLDVSIIDRFLTGAKSIAMPLALICVGGEISIAGFRKNMKVMLGSTFLKLIVSPAVALVLSLFVFGMEKDAVCASVLLVSMPSAVSSYAMADELGGDTEVCAAVIGFSTILSVVSITLIQFILQRVLI